MFKVSDDLEFHQKSFGVVVMTGSRNIPYLLSMVAIPLPVIDWFLIFFLLWLIFGSMTLNGDIFLETFYTLRVSIKTLGLILCKMLLGEGLLSNLLTRVYSSDSIEESQWWPIEDSYSQSLKSVLILMLSLVVLLSLGLMLSA